MPKFFSGRKLSKFWSNLPVTRQGAIVIAIPTICLGITLGAWIWSRDSERRAYYWIDRTQQVIYQSDRLLRVLVEAETGIRGYYITRDSQFLEPYQRLNNVRKITDILLGSTFVISLLGFWAAMHLYRQAENKLKARADELAKLNMEALINGLLQYSRVGRIKGDLQTVDVGALLAEVLDSLDPPSEFRIKIEGEMPTLVTELLPLQQVFINLISNAIKPVWRSHIR